MRHFTFALECPKCGNINTASKFIFAKNEIECGHCGELINVKQSRMISKQCPYCGKAFIHDQGKKGDIRCPHCERQFPVYAADTYRYKMTNVHCPQCGCGVEAALDNKHFTCPLCDTQFDVSTVKAKEDLVQNNTVSTIEYEGDNSTFVWKHPVENFNMGSQLIVHESQEAVVFINGQPFGPYTDGKYTLDGENIPFLKSLFETATDTNTPFHCEVYFVNLTVHMGIKWGTQGRVRFIEPETQMPMDIGARGELTMQVCDSRKLLAKLVGTTGGLRNENLLSNDPHGAIQEFFRAPVSMEVKSYLGQTIKNLQLNILEIDSQLAMLSQELQRRISPRFEEYGLAVREFYVETVDLPEKDPGYLAMVKMIRTAWSRKQSALVAADVAVADRQRQLEEKKTEALLSEMDNTILTQRRKAETDAFTYEGLSQAQVMAAQGYNQKDVLMTEVQKAYAAGIGNMGGAGDGGCSGGFNPYNMAMGMAVGGAVGQHTASMVHNVMSGVGTVMTGTTPPPITPVSYHVAINNNPTGPHDWNMLQQLVQSGILTRESRVWKPELGNVWMTAGAMPDLQALFGTNESPVPGSVPPPL